MTTALLPADTPAAWLATHLAAFQAAHDEPGTGHRWTSAAELLADGAAPLRRGHRRLTADGTPPAAAAKWLVSWYAGGIAEAVGFTYATGAAALLPDPARLRFRVHPDGWPDRADPAAR